MIMELLDDGLVLLLLRILYWSCVVILVFSTGWCILESLRLKVEEKGYQLNGWPIPNPGYFLSKNSWQRLKGYPMRRFALYRKQDISGISGTGLIVEGVEFSDGRVALRWVTPLRSTCVYDSIEDVEAIHGHGGATELRWIDVVR